MMYDREVLFAVALLASILTAIPITLMALLGRSLVAGPVRPVEVEEPEPKPEPWEPEYYDGYHWEPTADDGDPYSWKRVRIDEVPQ